jgi:hypothetical protein
MAALMRQDDVLEELYTEENPSEINLKKLANLFGVTHKEMAETLKVETSSFSKNPYLSSSNVLKQWRIIFNLFIDVVDQSESELSSEEVKVKMQRWLKAPNLDLDDKSPLEMMMSGKARKVRSLLEQLFV